MAARPRTLAVDIGGTGLKTIVLDSAGKALTERLRVDTPRPATPKAILAALVGMAKQQGGFERVSVGFPGVVRRGVTETAWNLDPRWVGTDLRSALAKALGKPVRTANDADVQGLGVIRGEGVELVITLGTGFGSSLFVDGHLVPNVQLAHHAGWGRKTYEEELGAKAFEEGRQEEMEPPARQGHRLARRPLQFRPSVHRRRQREEGHAGSAAAGQARFQRRGPHRRDRPLAERTRAFPHGAEERVPMNPNAIRSDALVFFGATGDLAYKKIFPSLQNMIRHGNLYVPVIGVAKSGWTIDQLLRPRAREPQGVRRRRGRGGVREAVLAAPVHRRRLRRPATFAKLRKALGGAKHPTHYLAIPPSLFGDASSSRSGKSGCADGARVVIEKPFGHDLETARALNQTLHTVFPESSRVPHRPLPRQGGRREPPVLPLRQHVPRADLEPQLRGLRPDHDGRRRSASQGRGKFYDETGAIRDVDPEPPAAGRRATSRWSRRPRVDADRLRDEQVKIFRAIKPLKPENVVRGQFDGLPEGARRQARLDGRDLRGRAARDRLLALGGRAVLHPRRQEPAADRDGGASST